MFGFLYFLFFLLLVYAVAKSSRHSKQLKDIQLQLDLLRGDLKKTKKEEEISWEDETPVQEIQPFAKSEGPIEEAKLPEIPPAAINIPAEIPPLPPLPPQKAPPPKKRIEWERWVGVRGAALLGGIVLALAGLLFFQYSIEHGLISPALRVILGTSGGLVCLVISEQLRKKNFGPSANALAAAGLVILYASFWAAHVLYQLVGMIPTFVLMILVTITCGLLCIRNRSFFIAVLGLIGGFLTPLLLSSGSDKPLGLFGYVLLIDVGFIWVGKKQKWPSLFFLCLLGTFVLQALWILMRMGSDRLWLGIGILAVFAGLAAMAGRWAPAEKRREWQLSQGLGLLTPFLFCLYFAGNAPLTSHLYPLTAFLLLLAALALWVNRTQDSAFLLLGAAVASMATIGIWLTGHRLSPWASGEVMGSLVAFGLLFWIAGARARAEQRPSYTIPQALVLLVPFLFSIYLAAQRASGLHFYPLGLLLLFLALASLKAGSLHEKAVFFYGSAAGILATQIAWWSRGGFSAGLVGETLLFNILLSLLYQVFFEKGRSSAVASLLSQSGHVLQVGLLALGVLAFPFYSTVGPWPWVVGWLVLSLLVLRHASEAKALPFYFIALILLGVGLGSSLREASILPQFYPSLGQYVMVPILIVVGFHFLGIYRKKRDDEVYFESALSVLSLVLILFLAAHELAAGLSFSFILLAALVFGCLTVWSATRMGRGLWYFLAMAAVALLDFLWTFHYPHLNFDTQEIRRGFFLQFGTVLLFVFWPFAVGKRFHNDRMAWIASALAGPAWFYSLKRLFLEIYGASWIGILPVALGIFSLIGAERVRRLWNTEEPIRKSNLVWFLAVTLGFVSVAIPLQLENEWVTIGWALEGFLLTLLWRKLDHAGLKYFSLALLGAVTIRLIFNPYVFGYHPRSSFPVFNWIFYTYGVPSLCLIGSALQFGKMELMRLRSWEESFYFKKVSLTAVFCGLGGVAVIFFWINLAIADWFSTSTFLSFSFERHPARDLATSIAWALYAVVLLGVGMARRSQGLRWVSLVFLVLTIGKVFLYDLGELKDLYRVISLLGLAFSLIVVSLAYQRFVFKKIPVEEQ